MLRPLIAPGLIVLLGAAGCHRATPPAAANSAASAPAIPVTVASVTAGVDPVREEVVGTVRSRLRALVEAKVAGRIEAVHAVPGQPVRAGDTLATLDAREWSARRDQAQAAGEQVDRDLERVERLVRDGAATPSERDTARSRQRIAAAAELEAETMLGYSRVVAPFDGVVTRKLTEVGDLAIPGRPLFEVEDPASLRFEADVPEALLDHIAMGARLPVRIGDSPETLEGVVSEMAPVADPTTRTYAIRLDLPRGTGLRAGRFGRLLVPTGAPSGAHVPHEAVVRRGQMEYVYVVDAGHARLRLVRTGREGATMVELAAGADLGEVVVLNPPAQLRDGHEVRTP